LNDQVSKNTYNIANLMAQTRLVAADYRNSTGQALPVTAELARFDAIDKLNLLKLDGAQGIDALDPRHPDEKFLIKGRVIFKGGKARQKLGRLGLDSGRNHLLMVIYDKDYQPTEIYQVDRQVIESELANTPTDSRGSMTVAKYKAIGRQVWTAAS